MPKVDVSVKVSGATVRKVWIDGVGLTFDGHGEGTRSVTANTYHPLQYMVRGAPGTKYSVAITDPPSVTNEHNGTFDSSQVDMGGWWFNVEQ